jgi:hypothetical protein
MAVSALDNLGLARADEVRSIGAQVLDAMLAMAEVRRTRIHCGGIFR